MTEIKSLSFGIGCFTFEVPNADLGVPMETPGTYSSDMYSEDVRKALEAIPSIRDIDLTPPQSFMFRYEYPWRLGGVDHGMQDATPDTQADEAYEFLGGTLFTPHPSDGRLSFVLDIPERVQQRVAWGRSVKNGVSEFHVNLSWNSRFPVTTIWTESADDPSPSKNIVIFREFLQEELGKRRDEVGPIVLSTLGPSPFWVDCFINPTEDETEAPVDFELIESTRSYAALILSYDPDFMEDAVEALGWFRAMTADELGLFYWLVNEERYQSNLWTDIDYSLSQLVRLHHMKGTKAWFQRMLTSGGEVRRAALDILAAKSDLTTRRRSAEKLVDGHYAASPYQPFRSRVEKELDDIGESEIPDAMEMVSVVQSRHTSEMELMIVLGAAVVGGVAGSVLTALLS